MSFRTHRRNCWGTAIRTQGFPLQSELIEDSVWEQREGPWIFLYSQNSSRNLLGNSEKDPGRSYAVKTHRGICRGTARRTLDFPLKSELIEESVGEQREGPWIFLYSQNSLRNLLGNSEKDPGRSYAVKTHRESVGEAQEGPWTFL